MVGLAKLLAASRLSRNLIPITVPYIPLFNGSQICPLTGFPHGR